MATQGRPEGTAVARRDDKVRLPSLLGDERAKARIEPFLPEGVKYERVIAAAQLAAAQNPAILDCTPASIVTAVAKAMQSGLEIGDTAHLVPFGQTLTFVADYKGIAQLMVESGAVRFVEAHAVYEKDQFDYQQGSEAYLRHVPVTLKSARGALMGAYVILHLPFGRKTFHFMSIDDIEEIRARYSKSWKKGECPAWYAKKCVVRQAAKLVPKTPRLAAMLARVDQAEAQDMALVTPGASDDDERPSAPQQLRAGRAMPDTVEHHDRRVASTPAQREYSGDVDETPLTREQVQRAAESEFDDLALDRALAEQDEFALGETRARKPYVTD